MNKVYQTPHADLAVFKPKEELAAQGFWKDLLEESAISLDKPADRLSSDISIPV